MEQVQSNPTIVFLQQFKNCEQAEISFNQRFEECSSEKYEWRTTFIISTIAFGALTAFVYHINQKYVALGTLALTLFSASKSYEYGPKYKKLDEEFSSATRDVINCWKYKVSDLIFYLEKKYPQNRQDIDKSVVDEASKLYNGKDGKFNEKNVESRKLYQEILDDKTIETLAEKNLDQIRNNDKLNNAFKGYYLSLIIASKQFKYGSADPEKNTTYIPVPKLGRW